MIQIGWLVSDLLILYEDKKVAIKHIEWWLKNTSSSFSIWQYIAICYQAICNMVLTCIVASLIHSREFMGNMNKWYEYFI